MPLFSYFISKLRGSLLKEAINNVKKDLELIPCGKKDICEVERQQARA